ncbi:MAG TPA: hypothetical protein VMZ00_03325 [Sporichthya sp.]|nr:hypothetical protein [Sporichthya sp.]
MSLSAEQRAILDATAAELRASTPVLAEYLADGPQLLRIKGIPPTKINKLVPGWKPPSRLTRLRRRLHLGKKPRVLRRPKLP